MPPNTPARPTSRAATALLAYLFFMLTITLLILHTTRPAPVNLRPFATIRDDWARGGRGFVVNLLGNVVAFLPIGALLPAARGADRRTTAWHALAFGGGFSLFIELAQAFSRRRTGDVDDLILNSLGALLGFALYSAARRLRGRMSS